MRQAVTALILILDVLYCPFACSGSTGVANSSATSCAADSCCSPKRVDPVNESPRQSDDGCDGSCKNCLCGGAINGDETCTDRGLAEGTLTHVWLPVIPIEVVGPESANHDQVLSDESAVFPSGVALRALIQSFLL